MFVIFISVGTKLNKTFLFIIILVSLVYFIELICQPRIRDAPFFVSLQEKDYIVFVIMLL